MLIAKLRVSTEMSVLVMLVLTLTVDTTCEALSEHYYRNDHFLEYQSDVGDVIKTFSNLTLVHCSAFCVGKVTACKSFFHDPDDQICSLLRIIPKSPSGARQSTSKSVLYSPIQPIQPMEGQTTTVVTTTETVASEQPATAFTTTETATSEQQTTAFTTTETATSEQQTTAFTTTETATSEQPTTAFTTTETATSEQPTTAFTTNETATSEQPTTTGPGCLRNVSDCLPLSSVTHLDVQMWDHNMCPVLIGPTTTSIDAANTTCQCLGGHLISLDTDEKIDYFNNDLRTFISEYSRLALGLRAQNLTGPWVWPSGRHLNNTPSFCPDEPNGDHIHAQRCIALELPQGCMDDRNCPIEISDIYFACDYF